MFTKLKWIFISVVLIGLLIILPIKFLTKPLPGELVEDLGRDHVTDIFDVKYNSDPPTSGPHFPIWAKRGIYDRLISDGYLIHSMEHGYVILWYDCTSNKAVTKRLPSFIEEVDAHDETTEESSDSGQLLKHMGLKQSGEMSFFTPNNQPDIEIPLPDEFNSEYCKSLVDDLSAFIDKFERVIVAPRIDMSHPIVLTAWNRVLKLDKFDEDRILEFIKSFHNKGPEKTVEN